MKINNILLISLCVLFMGCNENDPAEISQDNQQYIQCRNQNISDLSHVIPCYTQALAKQPLSYTLKETQLLSNDITLKKYELNSQNWSPNELVNPKKWKHQVEVYIPQNPKNSYALVVINNGTNQDSDQNNKPADDYDLSTLQTIATQTDSIVISISDIPNQPLVYENDAQPLREDYSVARSWDIFMKNPAQYELLPVHIPMAASVSQAIRLAKQELKSFGIKKFVVTGASKRGWTAWLTAMSNPDVEAVVPFVFNLLNTQKGLEHIYLSYGKNWPIAFYPYYQSRVDQQIQSPEFSKLMKIEDPFQYLASPYQTRLNITQYIINASGDDFYVPDNTRFYFNDLPAKKSLRVAPNSDHHGILNIAGQSLVTFMRRFQNHENLPALNEQYFSRSLSIAFSERPVKLIQWTAINPDDRDFRYACGIRYTPTTLQPTNNLNVSLVPPPQGWSANYIEATFQDGYVATSQVYISPDNIYPTHTPTAQGAVCQSIAGRGLNQDFLKIKQ